MAGKPRQRLQLEGIRTFVPGAAGDRIGSVVGETLRKRRLERGLRLRDIADHIRIRANHLEAIESGRFKDLPGRTYAIGFVRSYADALGLDGEEMVRRFRDEAAGLTDATALVFPSPAPEGRVPGRSMLVVGCILAAVVYGAWYVVSARDFAVVDLVPEIPERLSNWLAERRVAASVTVAGEIRRPLETGGASGDARAAPVSVPSTPVATPAARNQLGSVTAPSIESAASTPPAKAISRPMPAPGSEPQADPSIAGRRQVSTGETETTATPPIPSTPSTPSNAATPENSVAALSAPSAPPVPAAPSVPLATQVQTAATLRPSEASPQRPDAPAAASTAAATAEEDDNEETSTPPPISVASPTATAVSREPPAIPQIPGAGNVAEDQSPVPTPTLSVAARPTAASLPAPPAPAASNIPPPPPISAGLDAAGARVVIRARDESWVQVRDADRNPIMTRVLARGDIYRVPNRPGLTLQAGNAGALEILVDGNPTPAIGPLGSVRRDVSLDPDHLRSGQSVNSDR